MNKKDLLLHKIVNSEEVVGIIGLGYVGLPLAVSFALENTKVIGFEKSEEKAKKLTLPSITLAMSKTTI